MTPLGKVILFCFCGGYLGIESYLDFRDPSPDGWVKPYALMLLAAFFFFSASDTYRRRGNPTESTPKFELPSRSERFVYKAMGSFVIFVGVTVFGISCWLACGAWARVAHWPRTNAILVRKEISWVGARLTFDYEAEGHRLTGVAFRWGSERTVRSALESYEPGTAHRISYDPDDPAQVETILTYNWALFKAPVSGIVISLLLIFGGAMVYRWSIAGRFADSALNYSAPN